MKTNLVIAFLDHPLLGAVQNNSTIGPIGSSPDPLSTHEGLADETTPDRGLSDCSRVLEEWPVASPMTQLSNL